MEIGTQFTFLSNGKQRQALFLSQYQSKIQCIVCNDRNSEGIEIEIDCSQIIDDNQISMPL